MEITQAGMAGVLRTRRSHVSITLSSLRARGYVEDRLGRIENKTRRRKVYFLTHKGYKRAIELRVRYLKKRIDVPQNGHLRTVRIENLNGVLGGSYSLAEILSCTDDSGVLDLKSLTGKSTQYEVDDSSIEHESESVRSDSKAAVLLHLLFIA